MTATIPPRRPLPDTDPAGAEINSIDRRLSSDTSRGHVIELRQRRRIALHQILARGVRK